MTGGRLLLSSLVVLAGLLAGCGVPLDDDAQGVPAAEVPSGLRPTDTLVATTAVAETETVTIWFVRDGRLVPARHRVAAPVTPPAVLSELLLGPTAAEQTRALRTAIPDADAVTDVSVAGGVAAVQLTQAFAEIPAADQIPALGQLVMTLTDLRGVGRVRFVLDDAVIAVPLPTGEVAEGSVSRDDFAVLVEPGI